MSASLVGSEMCIRDSHEVALSAQSQNGALGVRRRAPPERGKQSGEWSWTVRCRHASRLLFGRGVRRASGAQCTTRAQVSVG
eukprot:5785799-Alexandrium_andersonii.AAC.1